MRVTVNGEQREIASRSVDALLSELEYEGTHFAIHDAALQHPEAAVRMHVSQALRAKGFHDRLDAGIRAHALGTGRTFR